MTAPLNETSNDTGRVSTSRNVRSPSYPQLRTRPRFSWRETIPVEIGSAGGRRVDLGRDEGGRRKLRRARRVHARLAERRAKPQTGQPPALGEERLFASQPGETGLGERRGMEVRPERAGPVGADRH